MERRERRETIYMQLQKTKEWYFFASTTLEFKSGHYNRFRISSPFCWAFSEANFDHLIKISNSVDNYKHSDDGDDH